MACVRQIGNDAYCYTVRRKVDSETDFLSSPVTYDGRCRCRFDENSTAIHDHGCYHFFLFFFGQQTKTFVILTTVFLHPNLSSGTLNPTIPIPLHLIFLCRMLNGIEVTFLSLTIQK